MILRKKSTASKLQLMEFAFPLNPKVNLDMLEQYSTQNDWSPVSGTILVKANKLH